jgi:hypothetical protein
MAARSSGVIHVDTAGLAGRTTGSGVRYLVDEQIFVVADGDSVIALLAAAPHIEGVRVLFSRSSGWFQGQHGEKFDRRGHYMLASQGCSG